MPHDVARLRVGRHRPAGAIAMNSEAPRDPEELDAIAGPVHGDISPAMTLGEVRLTVADLERSIGYYRAAVGLDLIEQASGQVTLGAGSTALLVLIEEPGA